MICVIVRVKKSIPDFDRDFSKYYRRYIDLADTTVVPATQNSFTADTGLNTM
jgi:hypothetical protein